jgi:hypothetical protein
MSKQKYRVFMNDVHEYNIQVDNKDGSVYTLTRSGSLWSEPETGSIALQMHNDGEGFHTTKIGKKLDYAQTAELSILLNFINWYENVGSTNKGTITIEAANEVLNFII